jgi:pimeloyl-ACP methyl ester carboxylesterase
MDSKIDVNVEGSGPPVVFIHGWAASQRFWKHQVPFFARKYQTVTYDLRGHGDSKKPKKGYDVSDHVDDLHEVITGLGLKRPILVGHSFGGMIALQYTLDHPDDVHGLVLVGTSLRPVSSGGRSWYMSIFKLILRISRSWAGSMTRGRLFGPDVDPELVRWVNEDSLRTPTRVVIACLDAAGRFNVLDRLGELSVPTAMVRGEFELGRPSKDSAPVQKKSGLIPHAKSFVIPKAGHNCMLEQPDGFNSVVWEYLTQSGNPV